MRSQYFILDIPLTSFLLLLRQIIVERIMRAIWAVIKPIPKREWLWYRRNIRLQPSQLWGQALIEGPPTVRVGGVI